MTAAFTSTQKLLCAEREVRKRKQVYPNRIETGRMSQAKADYEIAVMEAIADHFRVLSEKDRLL